VRLDGGLTVYQALRPDKLRVVAIDDPAEAHAPPPPHDPRGGVQYFNDERLVAVEHIALATFGSLSELSMEKKPAERDVKYWGGDAQPWRNGTTDAPLDAPPGVIAEEEQARAAAQAEDRARCPTAEAHAVMLHGCALRADFLFALTFALNLWHWETWQVVQFIIKPATEGFGRCRFADLPFVKPYTGPATVFVSHCWSASWGDLVAAACAGGRMDRFTWIDIVAVRQWPGNDADLDFQAVVRKCRALLVAAAPVPGIVSAKIMEKNDERTAYLASPEYKTAAKRVVFCRLWCVVELYAGLQAGLPIVFRGSVARFHPAQGGSVTVSSGEAAINMLFNFSGMVNVSTAECAVPADWKREMQRIDDVTKLNRTVATALRAGTVSAARNVSEVDAFICGEPEALRRLPEGRVDGALGAAVMAGQAAVVHELFVRVSGNGRRHRRRLLLNDFLIMAAMQGHGEVAQVLLAHGAEVNQVDPSNRTFPLLMAAMQGHAEVAQVYLTHGA
jgi:hypothetical protein